MFHTYVDRKKRSSFWTKKLRPKLQVVTATRVVASREGDRVTVQCQSQTTLSLFLR